jgi:1,4-alpha-glucan branching enzyme
MDRQGNQVVVLLNFSGEDFKGYTLGVEKGRYRVLFNSNRTIFGGTGAFKNRVLKTKKTYSHGKEYSIKFDLPKLTCVYLIKE